MPTPPASTGTPSRARIRTAQILAWLLAVVAAVPFFGLVDLATLPRWVNPAFEWPVPLEVSWGSLFTFLLAGSYAWIAVVPDRSLPALAQLGVAAVMLAASAVAGLDVRPAAVGAGVAVSAVVLGWLVAPTRPWVDRLSLTWVHVLLAIAAAILWPPYAFSAFEQSRLGAEGDITNGIEHWPVQGATGLTIMFCAAIMAVWAPARPLFRVTLSLSAAFIGIGCLAYPDRAGATEGVNWGIAVTLWAVLTALLGSPRNATLSTTRRSEPGEAAAAAERTGAQHPVVPPPA